MSPSLDLIPTAPKAPAPPATTREKPSIPPATEDKPRFADTLEAARGPAKPEPAQARKQPAESKDAPETAGEAKPPETEAKVCQQPATDGPSMPTESEQQRPEPAADPMVMWLPVAALPTTVVLDQSATATVTTATGLQDLALAETTAATDATQTEQAQAMPALQGLPVDPVASIGTGVQAADNAQGKAPTAGEPAPAVLPPEAELPLGQAQPQALGQAVAEVAEPDPLEVQGSGAPQPTVQASAQASAQPAAAMPAGAPTQPAAGTAEQRSGQTRTTRSERPQSVQQAAVLPETAEPATTGADRQRVAADFVASAMAETEGHAAWDETPITTAGEAAPAAGGAAFVEAAIRDKGAAPAAKPAAAGLPLPAEPVVAQIVERASLTADGGEMRIELKPEFLGPLKIRVATENHQVALKIVTSQPMVKEMIESQIHLLKNDLGLQGLHIDKVDVSVARDFDPYDESRREGAFQSARDNNGNGDRSSPWNRGQGSRGRTPFYQNNGQTGIDYFA